MDPALKIPDNRRAFDQDTVFVLGPEIDAHAAIGADQLRRADHLHTKGDLLHKLTEESKKAVAGCRAERCFYAMYK